MASCVAGLSGAEPVVRMTPLAIPAQGKAGYKSLSAKAAGLFPKGKFTPQKNIPIRETGHSRIPIYEESLDTVRGIAYAKDLLLVLELDDHDISVQNM